MTTDSFMYLFNTDSDDQERMVDELLKIIDKYTVEKITRGLCYGISKVKLKKGFSIDNQSEYPAPEIDKLSPNDVLLYLDGRSDCIISIADFFGDEIEYTVDELRLCSQFKIDNCRAFGLPHDLFENRKLAEVVEVFSG